MDARSYMFRLCARREYLVWSWGRRGEGGEDILEAFADGLPFVWVGSLEGVEKRPLMVPMVLVYLALLNSLAC